MPKKWRRARRCRGIWGFDRGLGGAQRWPALATTPAPWSRSVRFDTDGDGIKTATAWAGGAKAAHGFAAPAELYSNHDGSFSAADAQFTSLRVWHDLNQDGISQAAELRTLADNGVHPLRRRPAVRSGGFTRGDGAGGQAGSFLLAQDSFVRKFVSVPATLLSFWR